MQRLCERADGQDNLEDSRMLLGHPLHQLPFLLDACRWRDLREALESAEIVLAEGDDRFVETDLGRGLLCKEVRVKQRNFDHLLLASTDSFRLSGLPKTMVSLVQPFVKGWFSMYL